MEDWLLSAHFSDHPYIVKMRGSAHAGRDRRFVSVDFDSENYFFSRSLLIRA